MIPLPLFCQSCRVAKPHEFTRRRAYCSACRGSRRITRRLLTAGRSSLHP